MGRVRYRQPLVKAGTISLVDDGALLSPARTCASTYTVRQWKGGGLRAGAVCELSRLVSALSPSGSCFFNTACCGPTMDAHLVLHAFAPTGTCGRPPPPHTHTHCRVVSLAAAGVGHSPQ